MQALEQLAQALTVSGISLENTGSASTKPFKERMVGQDWAASLRGLTDLQLLMINVKYLGEQSEYTDLLDAFRRARQRRTCFQAWVYARHIGDRQSRQYYKLVQDRTEKAPVLLRLAIDDWLTSFVCESCYGSGQSKDSGSCTDCKGTGRSTKAPTAKFRSGMLFVSESTWFERYRKDYEVYFYQPLVNQEKIALSSILEHWG